MFSFYKAAKRAIQERDAVTVDKNFWMERCLKLEKKLEDRSDLFIEREFKLIDRFLTSTAKTFAITPEIEASKQITQDDVDTEAWEAFRLDKIDFLVECLQDAGITENVRERAVEDFNRDIAKYRQDFQFETL